MRSRTALRAGTLTLAGLLLTAGCASDEEPRSEATPSPAASSSAASPEAPVSTSAPATPAAPSVTPAAGTAVDLPSVSLVLPVSMEKTGNVGNNLLRVVDFTSTELAAVLYVGEQASLTGDKTLDELASDATENATGPVERLPDREVGGEQVYVLQTEGGAAALTYEVGRLVGDKVVDLTFGFMEDAPANTDVIESVLATVQWKG